jgi:hypothetical protein
LTVVTASRSARQPSRAAIKTPSSFEELLAEYQRLGIPTPDWLKAKVAEEAAGKEPVQTATR